MKELTTTDEILKGIDNDIKYLIHKKFGIVLDDCKSKGINDNFVPIEFLCMNRTYILKNVRDYFAKKDDALFIHEGIVYIIDFVE